MKSLKKIVPGSLRRFYNIAKETSNLNSSKLKRQFFRPSLPRLENGAINLHLGCGLINHPKFINIDALPAPHIHYVRGIDNLSNFNNCSVDLIYACHCLEHFKYNDVPQVLTEWYRVLKQGGICRISVPDFDLLLDIYKDNQNEIDFILPPLMGGQDYKFNFHMTAFNKPSLERILKDIGFKEVQDWQPNSCELTTFNDFSTHELLVNGKHYFVSLNLQAIK